METEIFRTLKVGDKILHPERPNLIFTVVNNDPPGNLILIPGRITRIATRAVHPDRWELAPDQRDAGGRIVFELKSSHVGDAPVMFSPDQVRKALRGGQR
jgi:hypothetical protein